MGAFIYLKHGMDIYSPFRAGGLTWAILRMGSQSPPGGAMALKGREFKGGRLSLGSTSEWIAHQGEMVGR